MTKRKGVVLAGGTGSRLFPITLGVSKQLIPVYDKPMIYYPLSVLMLAGIREVLFINNPNEAAQFKALLGDGSAWGMRFEYTTQERPEGIAQSLILAEKFLDGSPLALILGDNIFFGNNLQRELEEASSLESGATVFGYHTQSPQDYGVAEFDADGRVIGIEEKPAKPKSRYAITGLYFFDHTAVDIAKTLRPSARGELEITDVNSHYLREGRLHLKRLGRGIAWLDTGSPDNMLAAGNFIQTIVTRQGLQIACPEEIAFNRGWIGASQLRHLAEKLGKTAYARYLFELSEEQN